MLQNGAQQAADDLGIEIKFVYSDWNAEKMITNFRQGMATNPDGMVVIGAPGDDAYMPLIGEPLGAEPVLGERPPDPVVAEPRLPALPRLLRPSTYLSPTPLPVRQWAMYPSDA